MGKIYDEIKFYYAHKLPEAIRKATGCTEKEGLIAIKVSTNSLPTFEYDKVETTTTEYINNLMKENEGLTVKDLNRAFSNPKE